MVGDQVVDAFTTVVRINFFREGFKQLQAKSGGVNGLVATQCKEIYHGRTAYLKLVEACRTACKGTK